MYSYSLPRKIQSQTTNIVNELHDQAILLLKNTQNYVKNEQPKDLIGRSNRECIKIYCESTRIVTRLVHVISWILLHQGTQMRLIIHSRAQGFDFPQNDLYLNEAAEQDPSTPEKIRKLLTSSKELYLRVAKFAEMQELSSTTVTSSSLH